MASPAVDFARSNQQRFIDELKDLLRIPSVSTALNTNAMCKVQPILWPTNCAASEWKTLRSSLLRGTRCFMPIGSTLLENRLS